MDQEKNDPSNMGDRFEELMSMSIEQLQLFDKMKEYAPEKSKD
ncbi:hypothetical protein LCGC14_0930530 [marine sediment metagenome]|uniref:Uncharacterized protein n=1 Tax=marine sediment metagenome TaxID=412755 RepID=A0A0F9P918_9ZZZZ